MEPPRYVCADCTGGLIHPLITLHAAEETIIVCGGQWEALPEYLRQAYNLGAEAKGKGLNRRREAVADIREHIRIQS